METMHMNHRATRWPLLAAAVLTAVSAWAGEVVLTPSHASAERRIQVTSSDFLIPHLVDGAGWQTTILLTNLTETPTHFVLISAKVSPAPPMGAIGASGFPFKELGEDQYISGSLEPGQSVEISTPGESSDLSRGWASVLTLKSPWVGPASLRDTTQKPIGGYVIYRQRIEGRPDRETIAPLGQWGNASSRFFFDHREGGSTGFVVYGAMASDGELLTLVARDLDGVEIMRKSVPVVEGDSIAFSLTDRFPELQDRHGVIEVVSEPNSYLTIFALSFDASGAFSVSHSLKLGR